MSDFKIRDIVKCVDCDYVNDSIKDNPFDYFEEMHINRKNKSVVLIKSGYSIRVYNDLTPEGGKRIELWNVIAYLNDKCEIADENMRKAIECACEIYDMIFKAQFEE